MTENAQEIKARSPLPFTESALRLQMRHQEPCTHRKECEDANEASTATHGEMFLQIET